MSSANTVPQLSPSCLASRQSEWLSSPVYEDNVHNITTSVFLSVANALLCNPQLNSTHLFRADILWDSSGELKTPAQLESDAKGVFGTFERHEKPDSVTVIEAEIFPGFTLDRTVVRRLIPRKPQLDDLLEQTCQIYRRETLSKPEHDESGQDESRLLVYRPHISCADSMPWYHPPVKALAFLLKSRLPCDLAFDNGSPFESFLSLHILPFPTSPISSPIPMRLHRTLLSLLSTYTRLCRSTPQPTTTTSSSPPPSHQDKAKEKDPLVPRHLYQNTYTLLKQTYAPHLISHWAEQTEPSKHVFEDLSIAAFLIELWRRLYGIAPKCDRGHSPPNNHSINSTDETASAPSSPQQGKNHDQKFPGFVDLACGNGVLVHILLSEGYHPGWGFDARARKSWSHPSLFPSSTKTCLKELICLPQPFADQLSSSSLKNPAPDDGGEQAQPIFQTHNGLVGPGGVFIISNHADELTPWTPLLAALSNPKRPNPWLAIPCCSHALSGARNRYRYRYSPPPPELEEQKSPPAPREAKNGGGAGVEKGDLKTLKASRQGEKSQYACLTAHVERLARNLGYEVTRNLMRIPSTRNVGVVGIWPGSFTGTDRETADGGGVRRWGGEGGDSVGDGVVGEGEVEEGEEEVKRRVQKAVEEGCRADGGVESAAKMWWERGVGLQRGSVKGH
ncbi:MAG: hypothetical protein Q9227_007160 [Pyrenula ochraceoflavens]